MASGGEIEVLQALSAKKLVMKVQKYSTDLAVPNSGDFREAQQGAYPQSNFLLCLCEFHSTQQSQAGSIDVRFLAARRVSSSSLWSAMS